MVRKLTLEDMSEIMRVEKETWPADMRASEDNFKSRLEIFPDGVLGVFIEGVLVGVTTSQIVDYVDINANSWDTVTDDGSIKNTHNSNGNMLYVVSVGVSGEHQGEGAGSFLIKRQQKLAKDLDLDGVVLGARVPEYAQHDSEAINYFVTSRRKDGQARDKEIRFYERAGFRIVGVMPNFSPDDKESAGYGVIMRWDNSDKLAVD